MLFFSTVQIPRSLFPPPTQVIALNICPDLGERVMLSGERCVIEELFPEVAQAMMDARSSLAWNHDHRFIIRYEVKLREVRG